MKGGHAKHQLWFKTIRKLKIDLSDFEPQNQKLMASLFNEEQKLLFSAN